MGAGGTIDASPFVAGDGSVYLHYADDNGIRGQRLTADGLALAGGERMLVAHASGYPWESVRIEGPSMFTLPDGRIALLYSAGRFWEPTYSVAAASCDSPLGPCHRVYSTPLLASRDAMVAPGGQTPFQRNDGTWHLAFHGYTSVVGGSRQLRSLPITFPFGRPAVG